MLGFFFWLVKSSCKFFLSGNRAVGKRVSNAEVHETYALATKSGITRFMNSSNSGTVKAISP